MAELITPAERAEGIALAVLHGEVSMADARESLRLALRESEVTAGADALSRYRQGAPVWAWPRTAPWLGF